MNKEGVVEKEVFIKICKTCHREFEPLQPLHVRCPDCQKEKKMAWFRRLSEITEAKLKRSWREGGAL